jgi:hypothetical protein
MGKSLSILSKLIYNYNWVLLLLDGLEDQRPHSRLESTFRRLVKQHLASLLEYNRVYWKHRNSFRWVKLADENTQFFSHFGHHCSQEKFYCHSF